MSLKEVIEEMKEQLEKEEETSDAEETPAEEPTKEPEKEEAPAEDKKQEAEVAIEETPAEEKPDDAGYARLRREAAANKKRAEQAEERIAALEKSPAGEETAGEDPARVEMDPEIKEIIIDRRLRSATEEFLDRENTFKKSNPGYSNVAAEYGNAIARSIQIQHPKYTPQKIAEETQRTIITKAANYLKDGFDPIEELYHEAKDLGFTGESVRRKPEAKEETSVEVKPDMAKVAANRKKSTGMAASSGKSEQSLTKAAASELSVAEWQKLPAEEKRRLMSS